MYIRVQKYASVYYLQNSTQFILLLDRLPEASITPIIRAVSREKETLLYEAKQSIAFPFFIQFRQGSFTRDTSHDGLHFSCRTEIQGSNLKFLTLYILMDSPIHVDTISMDS